MTADTPEDPPIREHIDTLEETVDDLRRELATVKNRLHAIETAKDAPPADRFDGPVLAALEPGETVTTAKLRTLYQTRTPIQQESTARDRLKSLTKRPEFDFIKPGRWVYDPEGIDE